jgi:hypothetical protein
MNALFSFSSVLKANDANTQEGLKLIGVAREKPRNFGPN